MTAAIVTRLRAAANRCTRRDADVALLCEHALDAAMELDRLYRRRIAYVCPQCHWTLEERDEVEQLRGENSVLASILRGALAVIHTIEPENDDEAERLFDLRVAMTKAVSPYKRDGTLL